MTAKLELRLFNSSSDLNKYREPKEGVSELQAFGYFSSSTRLEFFKSYVTCLEESRGKEGKCELRGFLKREVTLFISDARFELMW